MSDTEPKPADTATPVPEERRLELPVWVPAAIGLTLVLLAAMAVYTGFRTQVRPHERSEAITPFTEADGLYPEESGGPPGAPGPGDSRLRSEGEIPAPDALGEAPATGLAITGDSSGVTGRKNLSVRRGLVFDVTPPDAVIYVNDVAVGSARQFDSHESVYEFAEEGVFTVRIAAPGFQELELVVSAGPDATDETAEVDVRLEPAR